MMLYIDLLIEKQLKFTKIQPEMQKNTTLTAEKYDLDFKKIAG